MLDFMAPEVGLEPTTLRLTAVEAGVVPVTICCHKLIVFSYLRRSLHGAFTTRTACFATGFERVTTQNPPHFLTASLRRPSPPLLISIAQTATYETWFFNHLIYQGMGRDQDWTPYSVWNILRFSWLVSARPFLLCNR